MNKYNDYYNKVKSVLNKNVTAETSLKIINKNKSILPSEDQKNKLYWYYKSYNVFLKLFNSTLGKTNLEEWIKRVSCIYSWIAGIPRTNFESEIINKLNELENTCSKFKLWELTSMSWSVCKIHKEKELKYTDIILRDFKKPQLIIQYFLKLACKLLNNSEGWDLSIASASKLLHFMLPKLFPILDTKVCQMLFGNKHYSYNKYYVYISALKNFLDNNSEIVIIANKNDMSPLRLVDIVLFNINK